MGRRTPRPEAAVGREPVVLGRDGRARERGGGGRVSIYLEKPSNPQAPKPEDLFVFVDYPVKGQGTVVYVDRENGNPRSWVVWVMRFDDKQNMLSRRWERIDNMDIIMGQPVPDAWVIRGYGYPCPERYKNSAAMRRWWKADD